MTIIQLHKQDSQPIFGTGTIKMQDCGKQRKASVRDSNPGPPEHEGVLISHLTERLLLHMSVYFAFI